MIWTAFVAFLLTLHLGFLLGYASGWRPVISTIVFITAAIFVASAILVLGPSEAANSLDPVRFVSYAIGWTVGYPFGETYYRSRQR